MSKFQIVNIVADADHSIAAFGAPAPVEFTISASASDGANITPAGEIKLVAGASQDFVVTAAEGFVLKSILVDGVEVLIP